MFYFNGVYHMFTQQFFSWVRDWNGGIGSGHLVSSDLAHWQEIGSLTGHGTDSDGLVPGHWQDPDYGDPTGGYYTGSVTMINGKPAMLTASVWGHGNVADRDGAGKPSRGFTTKCAPTDLPDNNPCHIEYQVSYPLNLSDPNLVWWSRPKTIVRHELGIQPHPWMFPQDPSTAWEDPTTPGRWTFIGQTAGTAQGVPGIFLEQWALKQGSHCAPDAGPECFDTENWESLGNFFPGTGDERCPTWGCGECCPSFFPLGGYHVLYGCANHYWIGNYSTSPRRTALGVSQQSFVPITNRLHFDVPQHAVGGVTSAAKGFWDEHSGRYLHWMWVHSGSKPRNTTAVDAASSSAFGAARGRGGATSIVDGAYDRLLGAKGAKAWDSMLSLPRVMTLDPLRMQLNLYPAEEISLLRRRTLITQTELTPRRGLTRLPLEGEAGATQLDLEVRFVWRGGVPPETQVGVAVLQEKGTGARNPFLLVCPGARIAETLLLRAGPERTVISIASGSHPDPSTCLPTDAVDPRCPALVADTTASSAHPGVVGTRASTPLDLETGEAELVLRVLVDRSAVEAFAQQGRAQVTARAYPVHGGGGVSLLVDSPAAAPLPVVSVAAWEMDSAFDDAGHPTGVGRVSA